MYWMVLDSLHYTPAIETMTTASGVAIISIFGQIKQQSQQKVNNKLVEK